MQKARSYFDLPPAKYKLLGKLRQINRARAGVQRQDK